MTETGMGGTHGQPGELFHLVTIESILIFTAHSAFICPLITFYFYECTPCLLDYVREECCTKVCFALSPHHLPSLVNNNIMQVSGLVDSLKAKQKEIVSSKGKCFHVRSVF